MRSSLVRTATAVFLVLLGTLAGWSGGDPTPQPFTSRDNFSPGAGKIKRLSPDELDKALSEEHEKESPQAKSDKKGTPQSKNAVVPAHRLSRDVAETALADETNAKLKRITLRNSFIEKYKNRATISTPFRVVFAAKKPHVADEDGDLHVAGLADEVGLPCVAELMNAKDFQGIVEMMHDLEESQEPTTVTGAWRLWCEHPGKFPHIQDDVIPPYKSTNPDHVFEIHPLTQVANAKALTSFKPIPGYDPKEAKKAFQVYESLSCTIIPDPDHQTTTIMTPGVGYNYVEFKLRLEEDEQFLTFDGRIVRCSALTLDGEELAHNRRMIFVKNTPPEKAVKDLHKGQELHVLGIPRIDLALVSWRARSADVRPEALNWRLPYEIIVVGVYPDGHSALPIAPKGAPEAKQVPFPDFGHLPPREQYDGPLFTLSQDYPTTKPAVKKPDFLGIPFNENEREQNWLKYLLAVRAYCFEGNTEVDWDVCKNKVRTWYHAPWQHWGPKGREGVRGLTREATAQPGQLAPTQTDKFQTYAVAFYNDVGGYTIGRVWRDHQKPDLKDIRFEPGTVVFKLLFTQATADQVPYLNPPTEWTAYAEVSDKDRTRKVQKLRLLQMDIMVRDERAEKLNGTGWVFGTYCYNGKVGSRNSYENLVPVGLQWGNDPDVSDDAVNRNPTKTVINPKLKETVINPSIDLPPQHLGWNGRLNGPADYYASSCMSCHSTAQYPVQRYQNPEFNKRKVERGSDEWMKWFRNLKCSEPFSEYSNTTDFSLQLAIGIQNFHHWRDGQGGFSARVIELPIEVKRGKD
jgi:hypothetical protein